MATNKEFEVIKSMYFRAIGKASMKIDDSIKQAIEAHPNDPAFENGSMLTRVYKDHLNEATENIKPVTFENKWGIEEAVRDEDGNLVYDKKDAFKMLKAIDDINTYIL